MPEIREGLKFDLGPAGKKYLGDPGVVGPLIHAFVSEVLDHYKAFQRSEASREDAMNSIEAADKRYAAILAGKDDAYHQSSFLADGSFRAHVRAQPDIKAVESGDPNEAFWHWLGVQAIKAAKDLDSGTAPEEVGPGLQVAMRSAMNSRSRGLMPRPYSLKSERPSKT